VQERFQEYESSISASNERARIRQYDAFAHLCNAGCLGSQSIVSIFTAYFDESGTHDSASNIVVGGYIATAKRWKLFRRDWLKILAREKVKVLHRTDLESGHGEFKGWTDERRLSVIRDCHQVIKKYTEKGIGAAVIAEDFKKNMPEVIKHAFGGAYGWLTHDCMVGVGHWAINSNQKGFVQYVFEAGADGRHEVERMFSVLYQPPAGAPPSRYDWRKVLRIGGWSFLYKPCAIQLQAADWFAYEVYKHMDNRVVAGIRRDIRKSAWDLFRPGIDQIQYWDRARINDWVLKATADGAIRIFEEREAYLRSQGREDLI
jgi:hypothetical protein